jgi:predicted RecB family nuclease
MTEKERMRLRDKGIFTVAQLSYTFRPRKIRKRAKNPANPHYCALQALSIRENKIHIHGSPQIYSAGTKVYLDIEGLDDDEFYYLIGALVVSGGEETFYSFWANDKSEEATSSRSVYRRLVYYRIFAYFILEITRGQH